MGCLTSFESSLIINENTIFELSKPKFIQMRTVKTILFFVILASCSTPNSDADKQIVTNTDTLLTPESYKGKGYDEIGFELIKTECLGDIKIDMPAQKVIELLGEPEKKSDVAMWEADGEYHQTWNYEGITLDLVGEENKNQVVSMITITGPCALKTKRRIGIGSDITDVKLAYPKAIDPAFSDSSSLVAGTTYGGVIFNFEDQKVKQIFIGAAAE